MPAAVSDGRAEHHNCQASFARAPLTNRAGGTPPALADAFPERASRARKSRCSSSHLRGVDATRICRIDFRELGALERCVLTKACEFGNSLSGALHWTGFVMLSSTADANWSAALLEVQVSTSKRTHTM